MLSSFFPFLPSYLLPVFLSVLSCAVGVFLSSVLLSSCLPVLISVFIVPLSVFGLGLGWVRLRVRLRVKVRVRVMV